MERGGDQVLITTYVVCELKHRRLDTGGRGNAQVSKQGKIIISNMTTVQSSTTSSLIFVPLGILVRHTLAYII